MAKQQFQLRPKHLITATLVVCVLAIIALVIGVVGTFNPRNEERRQDEAVQQRQQDTNRVEVWKPNGDSGEEAVILNPDAVGSARAPIGENAAGADEEQAARNPFLPSAPSRRDGADSERRERVQAEGGSQRARPAENQPAQPSPSLQGPTVAPPSTDAQAAPAQPRSEPEPRTEPQPEHKPEPTPPPAPQPKPQQQNVIDNLF